LKGWLIYPELVDIWSDPFGLTYAYSAVLFVNNVKSKTPPVNYLWILPIFGTDDVEEEELKL
jgi:hypothetical protein